MAFWKKILTLPNALLLCAGLGTRFQPTTHNVAKPAIPFLNVPLMGYSQYYLERLGLKNLIINTHHLPGSVQTTAEGIFKSADHTLHFSHEPTILGSGGGIKKVEKSLGHEDFIVANGDEVLLFAHDDGFLPLVNFHKQSGALATLLTTPHPEAGRSLGGIWANSQNQILKLGGHAKDLAPEQKNSFGHAQHFTGVFVFSPRVFSYMPATGPFHIFTDCLQKIISGHPNEKILAFHDPKLLWLDISSERDYILSTSIALKALKKELPASQTLLKILQRFDQNMAQVGEAQWLAPGAQFNGHLDADSYLFMGKNSKISAGTTVHGFAVMGEDTLFKQGYIESSVIARNVHVHEMVSLRKQLLLSC